MKVYNLYVIKHKSILIALVKNPWDFGHDFNIRERKQDEKT